jgi:hypothetical protein
MIGLGTRSATAGTFRNSVGRNTASISCWAGRAESGEAREGQDVRV